MNEETFIVDVAESDFQRLTNPPSWMSIYSFFPCYKLNIERFLPDLDFGGLEYFRMSSTCFDRVWPIDCLDSILKNDFRILVCLESGDRYPPTIKFSYKKLNKNKKRLELENGISKLETELQKLKTELECLNTRNTTHIPIPEDLQIILMEQTTQP